jgi:Na+/H+-dicarboxylate symporter
MVVLSNATSTLATLGIGHFFLTEGMIQQASHPSIQLMPAWVPHLSPIFSNDIALWAGVTLGVISAFLSSAPLQRFVQRILKVNGVILNKMILPVMPIFIFGFMVKLQHDQVLPIICENYLWVGALFVISAALYLSLWLGAMTHFKGEAWFKALRNLFPAMATGFSTMSSAASMPLIILGSEKNLKKPALARSIIPSTINIHLMGDNFAIPLMAMGVMLSYGFEVPETATLVTFLVYFLIAKFAVAAVPGGSMLVLLPVFEKHLGFTPEMLSLMTAIYVIFDPILTVFNVMGHGTFAMVYGRVFDSVMKVPALQWLAKEEPVSA